MSNSRKINRIENRMDTNVVMTPKPEDAPSSLTYALDPNEVQIAPRKMTPVREAFSGLCTDEAADAYREPFISTFRELMNQPGIRRVLYQSEPRDRSILDVLTNSPIEIPVEIPAPPRRIQLTIRVDDSDNS